MPAVIYVVCFAAALLGWGFYFACRRRKQWLVVALIFSVAFFVAANVEIHDVSARYAVQVEEQKEHNERAMNDQIYALTSEQGQDTSDFYRQRAKGEMAISLGFPWNRGDFDILESGNLDFVDELLSDVVLDDLLLGSEVEILIAASLFQSLAQEPAAYLGKYCRVQGSLRSRSLCEDEALLAAFEPREGYDLLMETGYLSDDMDIAIIMLVYAPQELVTRTLREKPISGGKMNGTGIFWGIYNESYVFIDAYQGELQ